MAGTTVVGSGPAVAQPLGGHGASVRGMSSRRLGLRKPGEANEAFQQTTRMVRIQLEYTNLNSGGAKYREARARRFRYAMNTGNRSSCPGRYWSLEREAVIPTPLSHNLTRTRAPKGRIGEAPSGVRLTFYVTIEKLIRRKPRSSRNPATGVTRLEPTARIQLGAHHDE